MQSNEKQTNTTAQKDICKVVFLSYHDMKTKAKKQTKICIYIRYRKKMKKKLKKICKFIFLSYLCTRNKKQKRI